MAQPRRLSSATLASGRFLQLDRVTFIDRWGHRRNWEVAGRRNDQAAVQVVPLLKPSDRFVLIQQYRPPMDSYVLEFPAGLIDPGESLEQTAVREVLEETGYSGQVAWISGPACSSPGMTGETVALAVMEIDELAPVNADPTPSPEEGEDIEIFCVPRASLAGFLREKTAAGVHIDSRTAAFVMGLGMRV